MLIKQVMNNVADDAWLLYRQSKSQYISERFADEIVKFGL